MSITKDYFNQDPLFIGQPESNNGIPSGVYSSNVLKLDNAIKRHEKMYLTYLLGKELYAEYTTAPTDAKWNDLNALLYDTTNKVSPIANYIYFNYLDENSSQYNGQSFDQNKQENSSSYPVVYNQVKVWNLMVEMNLPIMEWLGENVDSIETTALIDTSAWCNLYELKNRYEI